MYLTQVWVQLASLDRLSDLWLYRFFKIIQEVLNKYPRLEAMALGTSGHRPQEQSQNEY